MLYLTKEFNESLRRSLRSSNKEVVLFSAFIKKDVISWLSSVIPNSTKVSVIARWQKRDIVAGASDIDVYLICKECGWRLGVDLNLHGKMYIIDKAEIYLGSANLTRRGLGIGLEGNLEFGTRIEASGMDLKKVQKLLDGMVWVDDELYNCALNDIKEACKSDKTETLSWSDAVLGRITAPVEYLWVYELPHTEPNELLELDFASDAHVHDYALFALDIDDISEDALKGTFRRSRAYAWIYLLVKERESINFGGVSSALHNALLDDPKPYRKDVKTLVSNIFSWIQFSCPEIEIVQHNVTKSMHYRQGNI